MQRADLLARAGLHLLSRPDALPAGRSQRDERLGWMGDAAIR
jgi:hypothetical protein